MTAILEEEISREVPVSDSFAAIGKKVAKYDSPQKVTGQANFLMDLKLPGMLFGKILRSKYAHARILRIDTRRAKELEGVIAVITAEDTPRIKFGFMKDNLPLKEGKVLSYRDEIAAVAAVDEETAARAIDLIEVEFEELPAVFDPVLSMKEDAPILREGSVNNIVQIPFRFHSGETEKVFHQKGCVVSEDVFKLGFMTHTALGTMGTLADYTAGGELVVYTNTQAPFMYQRELAEALGMDGSKVRVVQPFIGGAFGRGMDLYPIDVIASILAIKTTRPVKILLSREEDLSYSPTRQPAVIRLKTAVSEEGRLLARKVDVILDVGAYVSWGAFDARVMMATSTGQYRVSNVDFNAIAVYTNNPSSGTMRGAGNPQINFAIESQMDILAEKIGIDPIEFRIMNANRPGDVTCQGMKITTCAMEETIRRVAKKIGRVDRNRSKYTGVGFSTLFHVAGGARVYRSDGCGTIIKIDDFGKVSVISGTSEIGTGSDTSIAQIVAEEIGVPLSNVEVINKDTSLKPWDVGIHASRATFVGGNSALLAARDAKKQLLKLASEYFKEKDSSNLEIRNGIIRSLLDHSKSANYARILRHSHFRQGGSVIMSSAFYDPQTEMADENSFMGNISLTYGFGTQAALVEVDPETGKVKVLKVVAVHDGGRILNPNGAEGQLQGGIVMSLSYALMEQLILEEGMVMNPSFADYKLPTTLDIPEIDVEFVGEPDPAGPFGAKGIGEHGCIPTSAAIANAIYDAVKVRVFELPITPEKISSLIEEKYPSLTLQ